MSGASGAPVALVTGASGGIGLAVSRALARRGYRVVMAVRNAAKSEPLRRQLEEDARAARPDDPPVAEILLVDFASLASVDAFADAFLAGHDRLDLLVANAGVFSWRREVSADGFERTLAVNYLGLVACVDRLRPLLERTAAQTGDARIVATTSLSARWRWLRADPRAFRRSGGFLSAYGLSKLGQVLYVRVLAEELAGTGVTAAAFDPGISATGIFTGRTLFSKLVDAWMRRFAASPEEAAAPGVRLATDPAFAGRSGIVLGAKGERTPTRRMRDAALARRFVAATRAVLAESRRIR